MNADKRRQKLMSHCQCPFSEEEAGDADEVHEPGQQEAAAGAERQAHQQEEQPRPVELEVGDELLAHDGEDGREARIRVRWQGRSNPILWRFFGVMNGWMVRMNMMTS